MECRHKHIMADDHGETCMECGKVLYGYGYDRTDDNCIHKWFPDPDADDFTAEACVFCGEKKS